MRKIGSVLATGLIMVGLWAGLAQAQKKSVAEEILEVLRAENKISEEKYQELMNRAKAENEAREAGVEAYRRDPVKIIKADKSFDWLNRFSFFGDLRVRGEGFYQDHGPAANARTRMRYRLRFGAQMKISDELLAGIRLASGDANDPISTNETLTNLFTRKPVSIDQAYLMLTPKESIGLGDYAWTPVTLYAGKFANHFFKPRAVMTSEMIFDDDLSPEGLAETFTLFEASEGLLRRFQMNAAQWTVRENSRSADSWMFGAQAVAALQPLPSTRLTLAAAGYYFTKEDSIAQARNSNSSLKVSNSVILRDGTIVKGGAPLSPGTGDKQFKDFLSRFRIVNGSLQLDYNTGYARWPLALIADFAYNTDAEGGDDIAVWTGVSLGATRNPGDWAFSVAWARTETESVLSAFSYSDFGRDGGTNLQGPFVKIDYMLFPRLTISAKNHFVSFIDRPKGQSNSTVHRFQLDAQLTF
jgi:putative porin